MPPGMPARLLAIHASRLCRITTPGCKTSYPGYAPTAENMLYGGSPYPEVTPAGYGAAADFGDAG